MKTYEIIVEYEGKQMLITSDYKDNYLEGDVQREMLNMLKEGTKIVSIKAIKWVDDKYAEKKKKDLLKELGVKENADDSK